MKKFVPKEDQFKKIEEWHEKHWWQTGRRKIFMQLIRESAASYIKSTRPKLLDIGCGFGYLVDFLSDDFDTFGVDNDKQKVAYLKRKKINATYGEADNLLFGNNQFDIILAFDVLEHIKNDSETLIKWSKLLKKGGVLCVSVPMFQWMWGIDDVIANHYRRYSKEDLSKKLQKANFQIRYFTYYNFFLFPFIAIIRIINKFKHRPSRMSNDELFENFGFHMGTGLINKMLLYIFLSESLFLKFITFPFGVSSIIIGTKK